MSLPLTQHQVEIQRNQRAWEEKPLLQQLYAGFYARILTQVDPGLAGRVVEIGSGIGNLKTYWPTALATDLFPNPWLDLACDAYELPFAKTTVSHLILFDVFHHLAAPNAFLKEARRVLVDRGRLLVFEPFISLASWPAFGWFHHEPVGWRAPINLAQALGRPRDYYAAQGNATRLFFRHQSPGWPARWEVFHREAFASFSYLLSGGFSQRTLYPAGWLPRLERCDKRLSRWPRLFAARCLVGLRPA